MGGNVLETVDSEKDVGIHVHQSLKPSLQCAKGAAKANQVLGQLSRAVGYRDQDTFLKLYCVCLCKTPPGVCYPELVSMAGAGQEYS